jgi:hypothetical protein
LIKIFNTHPFPNKNIKFYLWYLINCKMKKKLFLSLLISALFLTSCKKDEETKTTEETQQTAQPMTGEQWLKQRIGQPQVQPGQTQQTQQSQQTQQTNATETPPGMNPPHGQPGHKCEIPVGAPLNSQPTTNQPQVTPQTAPQVVNQKPAEQPQMKINTNTGSATISGAKMNPPHGQDGHRCDVAVGAPLPAE